ncbi:MAG: hypothetical protein RR561_05640 [Peptostreptococcus sp.]|uniref:hypothetical protein n=1 Tax=Peptostreptococcus sp. TaxID=1262 RepID=UPI002FCB0783
MSSAGLIILILLSLFAIYCMVGKNGRGVKNYIIRNTVGVYVMILGLLSILKSNLGLIQGFYFGLVTFVISILTLFVFKKDYKKCQILNIIGIVIGTIATHFAYIR